MDARDYYDAEPPLAQRFATALARLSRSLDVHLLLTTVGLLLAAMLLSYVVQTMQDGRVGADLRGLTGSMQVVAGEFRRTLARLEAPAGQAGDAPLTRVEAMRRLTRAAELGGVTLAEVAPADAAAQGVRLRALGTFPGLMRFAAEAEASGAQLDEMKVERSQDPEQRVGLTAGVSFAERAGGAKPADPRLLERILMLSRIDPFRPIAGLSADPEFAGAVDLADEHRLTAITTIGETSFATIDGADYWPGDRVGGYVLVALGTTVVELRDEAHPGQRYILALPGARRPGPAP